MRPPRYRFTSILAASLVGLATTLAVTAPAFAHTEVEIEPARAGATNALVTINAESESSSAGIASLQVILPEGIGPADVTLVSAPSGWRLAPTADGYTVAGKALRVGTDARHRVRVRQLPTDPVIYFKILQTYSDGKVDRWIEIPSTANPNPDNPAPSVKLAGGIARTTPPVTTAPPTTAPATTAAPVVASPSPAAAAGSPTDGGANTGLLLGLGAVALLAAAVGGGVLMRRRRAG